MAPEFEYQVTCEGCGHEVSSPCGTDDCPVQMQLDDLREHRDCRLCWGEDLLPGEPHECSFAANPAMSEPQESELLGLLNAAPLAMWRDGPSSPWAVDVFTVGGWRVAVFFDGVDFDGWDYIEHAIAPDGIRYDSWPQPGENALPMSITHWQPAEMGPIEHVVRAMTRIAESFRAMASARRNQ